MFEILIGSFLLGSLSLAFREQREHKTTDQWYSELDPHSNLPEDFDISVYEPLPVVEPEYLQKRYGNQSQSQPVLES
ncbi:MAG: hypothetical protein U0136_08595 [Bdellovibrionota bacterium]